MYSWCLSETASVFETSGIDISFARATKHSTIWKPLKLESIQINERLYWFIWNVRCHATSFIVSNFRHHWCCHAELHCYQANHRLWATSVPCHFLSCGRIFRAWNGFKNQQTARASHYLTGRMHLVLLLKNQHSFTIYILTLHCFYPNLCFIDSHLIWDFGDLSWESTQLRLASFFCRTLGTALGRCRVRCLQMPSFWRCWVHGWD